MGRVYRYSKLAVMVYLYMPVLFTLIVSFAASSSIGVHVPDKEVCPVGNYPPECEAEATSLKNCVEKRKEFDECVKKLVNECIKEWEAKKSAAEPSDEDSLVPCLESHIGFCRDASEGGLKR